MKFEWDPSKAAANLAKHGVSFDRVPQYSLTNWPCQAPILTTPHESRDILPLGCQALDVCLSCRIPIVLAAFD